MRTSLRFALLALSLCGLAQAQTPPPPPVPLRFADFFTQPIGPRGVEPSAKLLATSGQTVQLSGFMVQQEQPSAGRFLFAPRPVSLSEHADGDADDLPVSTVTVLLPPAQRDRALVHQAGPITLTGRLDWGRQEGEGGRVSWLRLQLAPDALAPQASPAPSTQAH